MVSKDGKGSTLRSVGGSESVDDVEDTGGTFSCTPNTRFP